MAKLSEGRSVSQGVANFYDKHGWVDQGDGSSGEDRLFRRFPPCHEQYARAVDLRVAALASGRHETLLFVGCGDMPDNHVALTRGFSNVTCVDISETALDIAARKLGNEMTYRRESIVESTLPDNSFDIAYCAHVVYHIDKLEQQTAVEQLLRLVKPGGRVVIIYANPRSPFTIPGEIMRWARRRTRRHRVDEAPQLYYHAYPRPWWQRFAPLATIRFLPWEVIGSRPARALLRTETVARLFYRSAAWLELNAPSVAGQLWQYPIVVLDKKADATPSQNITP